MEGDCKHIKVICQGQVCVECGRIILIVGAGIDQPLKKVAV